MFNRKAFGKRLMNFRKTVGESRDQFAARLGISKAHITEIENGNNAPSMDLYLTIINEFSLPPDSLIRDSIKITCPTVLNEITEKVKMLSGRNAAALNKALDGLIEYLQ